MGAVSLIDVTAETVEKTGFFCKMSARGKDGYQRKLAWLQQRFAEGLRLRMLGEGERGFVEYIPGGHAWRSVHGADDYLFIHCLWVVGKSKGKGFGKQLLDHVIQTARSEGYAGVATLASPAHWLTDCDIYSNAGFRRVAIEQGFHLLALPFDEDATTPQFTGNFEKKLTRMGSGLVIQRTDQCPYLDDAVLAAQKLADKLGLTVSVQDLKSAEEVRAYAPTPYGVFAIALDGQLITHCYLLEKELQKRIESVGSRTLTSPEATVRNLTS